MRTITITLAALVAVMAFAVDPASAQNRRWCTQRGVGSWGFPYCAFDTFEQCRATASGTGAHCTPNPWYSPPQKQPRRKAKRRSRR